MTQSEDAQRKGTQWKDSQGGSALELCSGWSTPAERDRMWKRSLLDWKFLPRTPMRWRARPKFADRTWLGVRREEGMVEN